MEENVPSVVTLVAKGGTDCSAVLLIHRESGAEQKFKDISNAYEVIRLVNFFLCKVTVKGDGLHELRDRRLCGSRSCE